MATKSRTYLPSDWQLWSYTPVAGKFRLDFSTLDGSDVLGGSTDVGSIQVMPLKITNITLEDGQLPDQSIFSSFAPATMSLSAQMKGYDSALIKELYNGKQVFLTLKNEATNSHPTFGKNTVFFIGYIDNCDVAFDPLQDYNNITISATSIEGGAANIPLTFNKTNIGKDVDINAAFALAKNAKQFDPYLALNLTGSTATYEATGSIVASFAEILQDFLASEVAIYCPYISQTWGGSAYSLTRAISAKYLDTVPTTGELIPYSMMSSIIISQDGGNVPNAFDLSNSAANYNYGTTTANMLSNPQIYSATLDVPTPFLQTIANRIGGYTQKNQPSEIVVRTAQAFQPIIFDNNEGDYIWPQYYWSNGSDVKTTPTFMGGTYYHRIVGQTHTITPDDWQTTYQLWKGL